MRIAVLILALLCPTMGRADTPLDLLILIEKAKSKPVVPVTPPKASGFQWQSYAKAHEGYRSNGEPLVVMLGADWCGPCKTLKAAIREAGIGGLNYAYVDVDRDGPTVKALGYSGSFTIPKLRVYSTSGAFDVETSSPAGVVAYLRLQAKGKAVSDPVKASYSYRVERVARPVGFEPAYVAGQTFLTHIVRDHGHQIREVLNRVDISGMSENELFALHSLLHSGYGAGRWEGNTFVFMLPY